MIGFLQGQALPSESHGEIDKVIINVNGVGYELTCSENTIEDVSSQIEAKLWVYTHVREDIIQLFGFSALAEKQLFLSLIKVNGIGPKMATKVLSATQLNRLVSMIDEGDVKGLMKLPKVGKKTAEQIILSLKGKLVLEEQIQGSSRNKAKQNIVSALVHLGFKLGDVEFVVEQMDDSIELQQGLREGLSALTTQQ